ncbi:MAG: 4Fe-4S binding protein [Spirochaetes bacterium]|nr:4Fe-4S binding protein [Spirochaetota bacterium]MBU1080592.1 4Fe-4S binding protein [Spirochaetota bacterium]
MNVPERTLKTKGAPSLGELEAAGMLPGLEDLKARACLCIECVEEIPCNPCETSCPRGAIRVGSPITNLPALDRDKCTACGLCIPACPGIAITIKRVEGEKATIRFPWEYLPRPEAGDEVRMVDRLGRVVCPGRVTGVNEAARNDRTAVVTAEFASEHVLSVVSMQRGPR